MTLKMYSYKNCSTCKKAEAYLRGRDETVDVVDITQTPPAKAELKAMLDLVDGNIKKIFNTSGQQYRALKLTDKLPQMSTDEAIDLLSKNGKLVKRPFLLAGTAQVAVGFKEDEWRKRLP